MRGRKRHRKKFMKAWSMTPGSSAWDVLQESKEAFNALLFALRKVLDRV